MFNFFKKNNAKKLVDEELNYKLYERVKKEIESGVKNDGVWTKAYADAKGNLQKTKAIYIQLMDENLKIFYRNMQSYDWKKNRCQEWMIASGSSSREEDLEDRIEELEDEVLSLKNRLSD